MATMTLTKMRPAFDIGTNVRTLNLKEAATQTFIKGAVVYISAGYLNECSTDPTQIAGVALQDAHNSTSSGDDTCAIAVAEENCVFVANVLNGGNATAQTDVGRAFGIVKSTNWYVDKGDTVNERVIVENHVINPDAVGDTYGRVYFRFLGKYCQLSVTS